MIVRMLEILIIIIAVGGFFAVVRFLVGEWKALRQKESAIKENRRTIAVSNAIEALKSGRKFDIEIALSIHGHHLSSELQQQLRDALLDIAYKDLKAK